MDFAAFLDDIRSSPDYAGQIVYVREVPAREARYADPAHPLDPAIAAMLRSRGIDRLYCHQARAIDAIHAGRDVLIVTGTASGKSLCYALPILEALRRDRSATAMLLFPAKALCQDQFQAFAATQAAAGLADLAAGVFDGDTPDALRRKLRDGASALFTNPDMLHASLMPNHARWAGFLSRLRFLVVDELHAYSGIFGSNAANLFRRFFRLCAHYGSRPQVIACSATIGNPRELAERLFGSVLSSVQSTGFSLLTNSTIVQQAKACTLNGTPSTGDLTVIDDDGSPRGKRTYVFWNPPRIRNTLYRSRRSANVEAHELMALLIQHGAATITFSKAKMTAEMIHRYVSETLLRTAPHLASKVSAYRAGYLPEERRDIERRLSSGELLGVSATRALELGIDIGGLDASIIVGYPGTLAGFLQQSGRAGRRDRDSLAILVGLDTAVNQYVIQHPQYIFSRAVEQAVIDPDNPYVITGHLRCAAHELPLPDGHAPLFGPHAPLVLQVLQGNHKLKSIRGTWYHAAPETPQHEVSLRGYSDAQVVIQDAAGGAVLGHMSKFDASPILHPDAIYMHRGDTYRVLSLDLQRNIATVAREEVDYYTQPMGGTDVHHIDHPLREKPFGPGRAFFGEVTAHFRNYAYEKIHFYSLDALSRHGLDMPAFHLETMALWLVPPEDLMAAVRSAGLDPHNGLRGVGYATRMLLPLFMTCDTLDFSHSVGAVNAPWNATFIYERYPLGLGFTETAYDRLHEIMPAVLENIRNCPCEDGCPCCVGKPLRGSTTWNVERGEGAVPSKASALMILEAMLADRAALQSPDTTTLSDSDEASRQRLEQSLRRRLERMREPQVLHPIEPNLPTAFPKSEDPKTLDEPDVARRVERRASFEKDLRKRLAQRIAERGGLGAKPAAPTPPPQPTPPPAPPASPPQRPIELGDSLAARARRLRKR